MDEYKKYEAKLLPCPFCGGEQIRILPQGYGGSVESNGYSVDCLTCKARHDVITLFIEQAVVTWNRRLPTRLGWDTRRLIETRWIERALRDADRGVLSPAAAEIVRLLERLAEQSERSDA